jgi:hypothetical protein
VCQTVEEIRANDIVIKDLMNYESDYEVEKSSGGDGENEFRLLITRVMIANRVDSIQIKQDLQPLVSRMRWLTPGRIALIGLFMFMVFYTFVEVVGYAEALTVLK